MNGLVTVTLASLGLAGCALPPPPAAVAPPTASVPGSTISASPLADRPAGGV